MKTKDRQRNAVLRSRNYLFLIQRSGSYFRKLEKSSFHDFWEKNTGLSYKLDPANF